MTKSRMLVFGAFALFISACKDKDDPTPIPGGGTPISICGDITTPTTWTNHTNGVDYIVTCDIGVADKLVIEPGTEIVFKNNIGMVVENTGSLTMNGTASSKVLLHGEGVTAGTWRGIMVTSNNTNNVFTYAEISGAGQSSFDGLSVKSNIRLEMGAKLSINNTAINNSAGDGLYVRGLSFDSESAIANFSNNSFSNNQGSPINTIAPTLQQLDGTGSSFSGNTKQYITVRGGYLFGDHVWQKCNIPYRFTELALVGYNADAGRLIVQPGVALQFTSNAGLAVGEYSSGYMRLEGSSADRITLNGADGAIWKGLCFQSTNTQNLVAYTNVSNGGGSSYTGNGNQKGNIIIGAWSAGFANIQNTNISGSDGWGIYVTAPSTAPNLLGVVYSGNASGNYYKEP